ncbi:MAG: amidohydrolase [Deltaproteobacteria bacterium]|nr:amidohydrolase [Deltaproteobacteria bacterium]
MEPNGIWADLILTNGTIITVDTDNTTAQAVAVRDGKIIKVGTGDEMAALTGKNTKIIDLEGKTLVPGFNDSHMHSVATGDFLHSLDLIDAAAELNPTIKDLQERIREKVEKARKGEWIGGRNYVPEEMAEKRWPSREELDVVSPDNPVIIMIRGYHAHAVNSRALELAGITKDTPDPEGGVIDRDPATGEPTGVLRDVPIMKSVVPQPRLEDFKAGLVAVGAEYLKIGVTSAGEAGAPDTPDAFRAYQETVDEGSFKVRTYLMIREAFYRQNDLGLRTGFGNDRLRLGAVKIFMDGSIQCFTCAFNEPYITKDTKGLEGLRYTQEQINEIVFESHRLGYQTAIHAQGDLTITMAVNAIENAMNKYPRPNPRHRIEHCLCPTERDLERMKELGIVANFYLFHPWFWGDRHIHDFIGPERAYRMVPAKTAMDMGITVCAHSDCPVCTPGNPVWPSDPLWGMWAAVNRKTRSGADIGPQERLTPMEALRAYTINGAYATFEENIKGSIEPGKLADMVVLSDNPLDVDPEEIRNIAVEKTIIGGEIVYERR